MASQPESTIPKRSATNATRSSTLSDDDVLSGEDTSEVTRLFSERLQAWKHACGYLEEYLTSLEKLQTEQGKAHEKILKHVSRPLREAHHFDESLGGVAGMFENIRSNTQGIANSHYETAKALKTGVLPTFERLHAEIKSKNKELAKGAGKGSKAVDKAREVTQKHIQQLAMATATVESGATGKVTAPEDPYVLQRGLLHRLHKQVQEENNNRQDLLQVQSSFAQFEAHVVSTIQHGLAQFNTIITKQSDLTKSLYGEMVSIAQRIPPDFEWAAFVRRSEGVLIDPEAPPRSIANIGFPNQNHMTTQPLISGSLDRKGKLMRKYETSYYVVTPAHYLHEYKTDDNFIKDPTPELSLYLPECMVGGIAGDKFDVKGKDVSKGRIGNTMSMTHEYHFKAHTPIDAAKWWDVLHQSAGHYTTLPPMPSPPNSPTAPSRQGTGESSLAATTRPHPPPHGPAEFNPAVCTREEAPSQLAAAHQGSHPSMNARRQELPVRRWAGRYNARR
ncbi:hypothetical protein EJ06DRAFT_539757 [Trichodelitschia bisporula]|uniref:PH domain-containing protein n=1 Tax=Trichodelitschia bisporula TaxID=703511 RepID=A0A6G1HM79_9PEZI|nr:hypothetical protein EJ06DRAFT_539757 [Trichodelitschia bisporula]